ncbi:nitrous oxide reductase family maturation protein NosD [Ferrimonas senticii]|uniref:nitrous oxide reductase family maturation protein NosD n=1 Tax=Ferrimonas senticii TaxID=394566 RepID=UPI0004093F0B|nr:nitrous oxide reductase family maturation protein NosD [Ferrimonas senticii]
MKQLLLLLLCIGSLAPLSALAASHQVTNDSELAAALKAAAAGDRIELAPGNYQGGFKIEKPLKLRGSSGVTVDAGGHGSGVIVDASDVTVEQLTVVGFGGALDKKDAGILVEPGHQRIVIAANTISGPGFGVRMDDGQQLLVKANRINGNPKLNVLERGDGVYTKGVNEIRVEDNVISGTRDGVYLETGKQAEIHRNQFSITQYPVHFMYFDESRVTQNHSIDSVAGYALMSSERLDLIGNTVKDADEFGVLLNMATHCVVANNYVDTVVNPRAKEMFDGNGKGIFIYGAFDNEVHHNHIVGAQEGISMALGGEGNKIYANNFIDNQVQVMYIGNGAVNWSQQGRGNYWSNHRGWDLNNDGIIDQGFEPNDGLDRLFWIYPEAKFLVDSPVVVLLRWLDSQISKPAPAGVYDPFPLLSPSSFQATNARGELQ